MYFSEIFLRYLFFASTVSWTIVNSTTAERFLRIRALRYALAGSMAGMNYRRQSQGQVSEMTGSGQLGSYHTSMLKKVVGPKHVGPPLSPQYDPSQGYEPYWAGGDWVLDRFMAKMGKSGNQKATTKQAPATGPDDYCGHECNLMYQTYGQICGKDSHGVYKTFKNYCLLLAGDCGNNSGWKIAYRGPCSTLRPYILEARIQYTYHQKLVKDFYQKYGRPIGSAISTTRPFRFFTYWDDQRKK